MQLQSCSSLQKFYSYRERIMQQSTSVKRFAAAASLLLVNAIYMFYVTARSVVLPSILTDLNGMSLYSLAVILSSMVMAVTTPLAGKLGDLFGRKRIFLIGLTGYTIAVAFCAFAPNVWIYLVGIAGSGFNYALTYSMYLALLTNIYNDETRPKMLGLASTISSVSSLLGPVLGGILADYLGWRFIFMIMLPFCVANVLFALIGIPDVKPITEDKTVDAFGVASFAICVVPVMYLLTSAGSVFPWISVRTLLLVVLSAAAFVFLIRSEKRAKNPIIPLDLMKNPVFRTCLLVTVVSGLAYSGMNYLPMFYQRVKGMSSTASGMMTIPREIFMMTASFFTGIWLGKRGKYRQAMVLPILLFAVSVGMMALFRSVTPLLLLIIAEAFFGAADGMVLVSPNALAQRDLSPTEMGSGLSFLGFCSTIGNSAGSAITGCIVAQFWSADRAFADAEASVTALNHGLSMAFGLSFVCCVLLLIYLLRSGRNIEKSTV